MESTKSYADETKWIEQMVRSLPDGIIRYRVKNLLFWYVRKSASNKRWFLGLSMLGAALPLVVGILNLVGDKTPKNIIAACLSAIATLISFSIAIFRFLENWIRYRNSAELIKSECTKYLTKVEPYHGENADQRFTLAIEELANKENAKWVQEKKASDCEQTAARRQ